MRALAGDAHRPRGADTMSPRERQVIVMVARGASSAAIGEQLHLSPKTVDTYRSRLMAKLGLSDVPALVRWAVICTFPLMAMISPNKIPEPPEKQEALINPLKVGFEESRVLTGMAEFGKSLMPEGFEQLVAPESLAGSISYLRAESQ
jgi:DNA-binding CsgD family transcriptional regulator